MNIFQKLSFISKTQKAIKAVKTVLKDAETDEIANKITGATNKIIAGLTEIKDLVPDVKNVVDDILKALKNE